jgi:hypothetical protein
MIINASGRSALIIAAGLFVLLASPVMATDDDEPTAGATADSQAAAPTALHRTYRHALHHRRHYAHHKSPTIAKSDDDKKADGDGKAGDDKKAIVAGVATTTGDNRPLANIPPSIANANAQMLLAGAQISAAAAIPPGSDAPQTTDTASADNGTVMVASDQLNDSDRTLEEGTSTTAAAASSPPPPPATITGDSSVWDQTSLIGKIFIGFGALLTMASAARMFIT